MVPKILTKVHIVPALLEGSVLALTRIKYCSGVQLKNLNKMVKIRKFDGPHRQLMVEEEIEIENRASTGNIPPPALTEDDECFIGQDHPLMNHVILNNVFKHMRETGLKECRFVCKKWNVSTIPFTRKVFEVTIYGSHNLSKQHRIDNFVKVFGSNILGIPFSRFKVGSFFTRDGVGQEFLKLCGNTTKGIRFLDDNCRVEEVAVLLKSTPKLEALEIPGRLHSNSGIVKLFPENSKPRLASLKDFTVFYERPEDRNQFCPTFLEELITAAKNISCVHLWDSFSAYREEDHTISSFETLSVFEKLGRESSIKELNISHSKTDHMAYIELLLKMCTKRNGLKLKRFHYHLDLSDQDIQPVLKVISHFKDTLEFFTTNGKRLISFLEFPLMPKLAVLGVSVSEHFSLRYGNLREIFPVLEVLRLFHMTGGKYDEFFPESDPFPTVKSLQLQRLSLKMNGFNQMSAVFPNLTALEMNITEDGDEILRHIWTHMTQLESLKIPGTIRTKDSMDCVLTGIPDQLHHEIRSVVNTLESMSEVVERRERILDLMSQHSQLPSIGNLTKLRSLTLLGSTGNGNMRCKLCKSKYLRDFSGYLGFYSIKSLRHLNLGRCELTKSCCEILTRDMGLETWTFKSSEGEHITSPST